MSYITAITEQYYEFEGKVIVFHLWVTFVNIYWQDDINFVHMN